MFRIVSKGLINYWPIENDWLDYVGSSDMMPVVNYELTYDRFNTPNSAIKFSSGYATLKPDVYFAGDFSILVWFYLLGPGTKIMDCGNGAGSDNIEFSASYFQDNRPYFTIYQGGAWTEYDSSHFLNLGQWYHIAGVANGSMMYLYLDGSIIESGPTPYSMQNITRNLCYFGRSNWYPWESDANAILDDIKIYNRALSTQEILADIDQQLIT